MVKLDAVRPKSSRMIVFLLNTVKSHIYLFTNGCYVFCVLVSRAEGSKPIGHSALLYNGRGQRGLKHEYIY